MYDWFTIWSSIRILDWCLLGALGVVFIYQCYFYIRYIGAVRRQAKRQQVTGCRLQVTGDETPGVSVIVCARNEAHNLETYLQALLTQDYPTFELIVVDDESEDDTKLVLERYAQQDKRVKLSFVPIGARVGSSKKLALTLGAKAAQYDYLLLTDADCVPKTTHWISAMMSGFQQREHIEIVLGYGAYFYEKSALNRLIQYDTLFNGLHFLGAAITGCPYMGVGRNLAYRKSTFFDHGGFTHLMDKIAGDDDLFVNQVATPRNTAVVVGEDSITWSIPKHSWHTWKQQKQRHLSVSPFYKKATQYRLCIEPMSRACFYGLIIAIAIVCPWFVIAAAGLLFLIRLLTQYITLHLSAKTMDQRGVGADLILLDILLPVLTLALMTPKKSKHW